MNKIPTNSPWGQIDGKQLIAEGLILVSTSSHGGFWLREDMLAKVPLNMRRARFHSPSDDSPWFEEDSDWCFVALTFPEAVNRDELESAKRALAWGIHSEFSSYTADLAA